jgi:DNA-binding response OmpR family regulator
VTEEPEPKIILLDLHLPEVEGTEIFKVARANTKSTIIVVTADVLAGRDMFSKADHVFIKPLDIPKFMSVMTELL